MKNNSELILNQIFKGEALIVCKLLQNESYSIADIYFESGYNHIANFNKFFKTILRTTRSAYRKTLKR